MKENECNKKCEFEKGGIESISFSAPSISPLNTESTINNDALKKLISLPMHLFENINDEWYCHTCKKPFNEAHPQV